jgi:sodium/potassium-transporting ATPase subunit alpha
MSYLMLVLPYLIGDHPKTAEAIARKINLVLGDTRETLAKKSDRAIEDVYDDEVSAVVVHGDDIDELQGWQWDQSLFFILLRRLMFF